MGKTIEDDAAPPETQQQSSPLEQLTVVTYQGYGPSSPAGSDCAVESYPNTQSVDASSHELSWDYCALNADFTHATVAQDSRTLTDSEYRSVTTALAKVKLTHGDSCGFDASVVTLDVERDVGTELYANDFYAGCPWSSVQDGRAFASGLEDLANVTQSLAHS